MSSSARLGSASRCWPWDGIVDQFFKLLEQLILPNWPDLIALLPWVSSPSSSFALLAWRGSGAGRGAAHRARACHGRWTGARRRPASTCPGRRAGRSWRPSAPRSCCSRSRCPRRAPAANTLAPFNACCSCIGLIVTLVAIGGWLYDVDARVAGDGAAGARRARRADSRRGRPRAARGRQRIRGDGPGSGGRHASGAGCRLSAAPEPPPGVHMPGPSPWPFFAPIAMAGHPLRLHLQRSAASSPA